MAAYEPLPPIEADFSSEPPPLEEPPAIATARLPLAVTTSNPTQPIREITSEREDAEGSASSFEKEEEEEGSENSFVMCRIETQEREVSEDVTQQVMGNTTYTPHFNPCVETVSSKTTNSSAKHDLLTSPISSTSANGERASSATKTRGDRVSSTRALPEAPSANGSREFPAPDTRVARVLPAPTLPEVSLTDLLSSSLDQKATVQDPHSQPLISIPTPNKALDSSSPHHEEPAKDLTHQPHVITAVANSVPLIHPEASPKQATAPSSHVAGPITRLKRLEDKPSAQGEGIDADEIGPIPNIAHVRPKRATLRPKWLNEYIYF